MNPFKLFAGVPDFFRALRASSYKDVYERAKKSSGFMDIRARSQEEVDRLYRELHRDMASKALEGRDLRLYDRFVEKGFSEGQIRSHFAKRGIELPMNEAMVRGAIGYRQTVNALLEIPEYAMGTLGFASSLIGGTLGYAAKQGTKIAGKGAALGAKGAAVGTAAVVGGAVVGTRAGVKAASRLKEGVQERVIERLPESMQKKVRERMEKAKEPIDIQPQIFTKGLGETAKATGKAMGKTAAKTGRWVGKTAAEVGSHVARDSWDLARNIWRHRNSREMGYLVAGGTVVLGGAAYETGIAEVEREIKMQQMEANRTSDDGTAGGTFLRVNQHIGSNGPPVDDFGATGDLVFALHNLRHGG